jgi:hypothetical protein
MEDKIANEVDRELFIPTADSIGKEVNFIKNPLENLEPIFNFQKAQYILLGSNTGVGKAIWDNEKVLTPKGWKLHGSLKKGDLVIGSDGMPTEVMEVYPQGLRELYHVSFQDGTDVSCDAEHLWRVETRHGEFIKTTKELYESGLIDWYKGSSHKYKVKTPNPCHFTPGNKGILYASVQERDRFLEDNIGKLSSKVYDAKLKETVIEVARSLGYTVVDRLPLYINKQAKYKYITSIHYHKIDYCSCIKVEAEDSMYVVNGYNLTHNTSFVDHMLLSILDNHSSNLHVEVLYYSMERKKMFKYAKWISWKMKARDNRNISSDNILNRNGKLTQEQFDYIKTNFSPWLTEILNYVDIREGTKSLDEIERDIDRLAKRLGNYFYTDEVHIHQNGKIVGTMDPNQFIVTKYGKKLFKRLNFQDKTYTLYQNDSIYIPKKESLIFIVLDHIGKIRYEIGGKKFTLDKLDQILSNARDKYMFSPIAISQFNRGIGETDRQKLHKGDLSPTLEDFKDTGNLTESADLVISLFDPARYKSYNAQGEYKGYNIQDNMITPQGQQRARSLHVLKNTFGYANTTTVLRFTGESMYFQSLPKPTETLALDKIYKEIAQGK